MTAMSQAALRVEPGSGRCTASTEPRTFAKQVMFLCAVVMAAGSCDSVHAETKLTPLVRLQSELTADPDDMCFLQVRSSQTSTTSGLIVVSDKSAGRVLLFDGNGEVVDSVAVPKPGNIDVRTGFEFDGQRIPLIVVNQRETDPQLRALTVTDAGGKPTLKILETNIPTGPNYGGCLYESQIDNRLYFFSTVKGGMVQQIEIDGTGTSIAGRKVREWKSTICEGAVADDEAGVVFVSEEMVGIKKLGAEPTDSAVGEYILRIGQHKVAGDLEGITLYETGPRSGYLIVSDQRRNRYVVLDREAPHRFIGSFQVEEARHTDGIDLTTFSLGEQFPNGAFACHADLKNSDRVILLVPLPQLDHWIEDLKAR